MQEQETLYERLEPLLKGVGLEIVELAMSRGRGSVKAQLTVFSPGGTGTDECAKAHRLAYPLMQSVCGVEDPHLEVASPGIDRIIRSRREYSVFAGRGVRVCLHGEGDWLRGRIVGVEGEDLVLEIEGERRPVPLVEVAKARLDSTQEGD